jgi:hypothetical protein
MRRNEKDTDLIEHIKRKRQQLAASRYPDFGDFCHVVNPEMSDLSPGFQRPLFVRSPENSDVTPGNW